MPLGRSGGATRGGLAARVREADTILQGKLRSLLAELDRSVDVGGEPLFSGGRLSRQDFRSLLASDAGFQHELLSRLPWASEAEKRSLARELERVWPGPQNLPGSVATPPVLPFGGEEARGSEVSAT